MKVSPGHDVVLSGSDIYDRLFGDAALKLANEIKMDLTDAFLVATAETLNL